jgi:hypothetical protein
MKGSGALDTEGQELPNDEAARAEARLVVRELTQNKIVVTDERLVVTNADGKIIHEEPLFRQ